jgi:hypothetical protein
MSRAAGATGRTRLREALHLGLIQMRMSKGVRGSAGKTFILCGLPSGRLELQFLAATIAGDGGLNRKRFLVQINRADSPGG